MSFFGSASSINQLLSERTKDNALASHDGGDIKLVESEEFSEIPVRRGWPAPGVYL